MAGNGNKNGANRANETTQAADTNTAATGADTLMGGQAADTIATGSTGTDTVMGGQGSDSVSGGGFNDLVDREREISGDSARRSFDFEDDDEFDDTLHGSSTLDAVLTVGGESMPLGALVAMTHGMSGLSVDAWNDLDEADRDRRLNGVLDHMRLAAHAAKGGNASFMVDPQNAENVIIRVKQAAAIPQQDAAGHIIGHVQVKVGANSVPRAVADHEMVADILED